METNRMATKKFDLKNPRALRETSGLNQTDFWAKYGVTQSGGSRYENNRDIPVPIKTLMILSHQGLVSDKDLAAALKAASK